MSTLNAPGFPGNLDRHKKAHAVDHDIARQDARRTESGCEDWIGPRPHCTF
jgi:hypothetical protein